MIKFRVNSDKSISHRAIILGSLAHGRSYIENMLLSDDCLATINIFRKLGVNINTQKNTTIIDGVGLYGLTKPPSELYVGNSGTSIRLISGILANQNFSSTITGDDSIKKRPMKRIITPLEKMGASISSNNGLAPLTFNPSMNDCLHGITYDTMSSSAQVKSCILLSGLFCNGKTTVVERYISRNHTELMMKQFGADIMMNKNVTTIIPAKKLYSQNLRIVADISSAAFFIVAALLKPNAEILLQDIGLNETRNGILKVCKKMNADIDIVKYNDLVEPYGDILVKYSKNLIGTTIEGDLIPALIDEIPIISLLATQAEGDTVIKNIEDLKNKESNRLLSIFSNLKNCGADIEITKDSMIIHGKTKLTGANIKTYSDHRIAMMFEIASLITQGPCKIDDTQCIRTSYPDFYNHLRLIK